MSNSKLPQIKEERMREATENLRAIEKKISPFLKPKKIKSISTAGSWCDISTWFDFYRISEEEENNQLEIHEA